MKMKKHKNHDHEENIKTNISKYINIHDTENSKKNKEGTLPIDDDRNSYMQTKDKKKRHKRKHDGKEIEIDELSADNDLILPQNTESIYNTPKKKKKHKDKHNNKIIEEFNASLDNDHVELQNNENIDNMKTKMKLHKKKRDKECSEIVNLQDAESMADKPRKNNKHKRAKDTEEIVNTSIDDIIGVENVERVSNISRKKEKHAKEKSDIKCITINEDNDLMENMKNISDIPESNSKIIRKENKHKQKHDKEKIEVEIVHVDKSLIDVQNSEIVSDVSRKKKKHKSKHNENKTDIHNLIINNDTIDLYGTENINNISKKTKKHEGKHDKEEFQIGNVSIDNDDIDFLNIENIPRKKKKHKSKHNENEMETQNLTINNDIICLSSTEDISSNISRKKKKHKSKHDKEEIEIGNIQTFNDLIDLQNTEISDTLRRKKNKRKLVETEEVPIDSDLIYLQKKRHKQKHKENMEIEILPVDNDSIDVQDMQNVGQIPRKKKKDKNKHNEDETEVQILINNDLIDLQNNGNVSMKEKKHKSKCNKEEIEIDILPIEENSDISRKKMYNEKHDKKRTDVEKFPVVNNIQSLTPILASGISIIKEIGKEFHFASNLSPEKHNEIIKEYDTLDFQRTSCHDSVGNQAISEDESNDCFSEISHGTNLMEWDENLNLRQKSSIEPVTSHETLVAIEDPVDFPIPPLHQLEKAGNLSKTDRDNMVSMGIEIRQGKYSKKEDSIILQNWQNFVERNGIDDPVLLFGIGKGRQKDVAEYVKAAHMYVRLARGLDNRTLYSVYSRARVLLNPTRKLGKLSQDDYSTIKKLKNIYGNKWERIGEMVGRSGQTTNLAYRYQEKEIKLGSWSKEEDKKLTEAVENVMKEDPRNSCLSVNENHAGFEGISWGKVASLVPERNLFQCRQRWMNYLSWNINSNERHKWNKVDSEKLICLLKRNIVKDETTIDWKSLQKHFVHCSPSPNYIRKRWYYLKDTVPHSIAMSHEKIVKHLYHSCKMQEKDLFMDDGY